MLRSARLALTVMTVVLLATASVRAQQAPSGTMLYGIHHETYDDIGTHQVTFSQSGGDLLVEVKNRLKVKVLFITAYRFEANRREVWRGGKLVSYRSKTDDDGTEITVRAEAEGDKLVIEGQNGREEAPLGTFPTHPWNAKIVEQSRIMDTKTGELRTVSVTAAGEETIEAGGREVKARKYLMTGDMERELWFGPDGTWLQMRFDKDGDKITFTLM